MVEKKVIEVEGQRFFYWREPHQESLLSISYESVGGFFVKRINHTITKETWQKMGKEMGWLK